MNRNTILCNVSLLLVLCTNTLRAESHPSYVCEQVGLHLSLPSVYGVQKVRFSVANYNTSDFVSHDLRRPVFVPDSTNANALAIECPGYGFALVFGIDSSFLSMTDIERRLLDWKSNYYLEKKENVDNILQYAHSETLLSALPARELSVRKSGVKDTMYTELVLGTIGTRSYGVFMRAVEDLSPGSPSIMRLVFLTILNSIVIDDVVTTTTQYTDHPHTFSLALPRQWPVQSYRRVNNPLPFVAAPENVDHPGEAKDLSSDSLWNCIVVQLPLFQLEVMVHRTGARDSTELDSSIRRSLEQLARGATDIVLKESALVQKAGCLEFSFTIPRRGDYVRTWYWVGHRGNLQVLARTTAWQRDAVIIESVVRTVLTSLRMYP